MAFDLNRCAACGGGVHVAPWYFNFAGPGVHTDPDVRGAPLCNSCFGKTSMGFPSYPSDPVGLTAKIRARLASAGPTAVPGSGWPPLPRVLSIFTLTDVADLSAQWTDYAVPGSVATLKVRQAYDDPTHAVVEVCRNGVMDAHLVGEVVRAVLAIRPRLTGVIEALHACGRELQKLAPVTLSCPSLWTITMDFKAPKRSRARAERNALGHLCCSTVGCRSTSEYAEPAPDGSWTCGECRAVEDW